jgi:prolyl-tRNA synthetase
LSKEASHIDGFAKECAVVTHYRLKNAEDGSGVVVDPDAKLEEELIVRPTSETIIWNSYKNWIQSYRDLPILINQWANVVRWEMRTRLFLRTTEFLWQEGHTAHATYEEAEEETVKILDVYRRFAEEFMAMPVLIGKKTEAEKFAGAKHTYCIEAMMQDKKALQSGTSHNLGQNFAKAFDVKFQDKEGKLNYVWATSWGVSTRLIGALIMVHSDDNGLVLPPKMATNPVVIIPIWKSDVQKEQILELANTIKKDLNQDFNVILDDREQYKPGYKYSEWELQGIPLRIEIGPKDVEKKQVVVVRRDTREKIFVPVIELRNKINNLLVVMQQEMFEKAKTMREEFTFEIDDYKEFKNVIDNPGGFLKSHWCGSDNCEQKVKDETKATIRLIPFEKQNEKGKCIVCGNESTGRVIFAKAY